MEIGVHASRHAASWRLQHFATIELSDLGFGKSMIIRVIRSRRTICGLCALLTTVAVAGESLYSMQTRIIERMRIMDTSTRWYAVTYYVVGKPLQESRSLPVDDKPMSHDLCAAVAQRMNEAAEINEIHGELPAMFTRCEPAELARGSRSAK